MKKSVIIVFGVIILTLLFANLFVDDPVYNNSEQQIEHYLQSKQYEEAENLYISLLEDDSLNMDFHYGRIQAHFKIPEKTKVSKYDYEYRDDNLIYRYYNNNSKIENAKIQDVGFYGLGLYFSIKDNYNEAKKYFNKVQNKQLKYLNNSIGHVYNELNELDKAKSFLLKEISNKGNLSGSYSNLIKIYFKENDLSSLESLANNHETIKYFSNSDLSELYFKQGKIGKYLISIFSIGFNNVDFKSFLSALLIALAWLLYFRQIDIYKPEKFHYIAGTFILGIVFSYGTFMVGDFNNHILGFKLNGNLVNDFIYCFIGIGLVEEIMKLIPFLLIIKFTDEVDEPIDFIIYPAVSAIGFAFSENILYFHGIGLDIIHGRALISVVVHMICSSLIGYGMLFGFLDKKIGKNLRIGIFLTIAAFAHGFFDFWLINKTVNDFAFISIILVIVGLTQWNKFINNAINFSIPEKENIKTINMSKLQDYLIYTLSGILIFEFLIITATYGVTAANNGILKAAYTGAYLIPFISSSMSEFRFRKGKLVSELPKKMELNHMLDKVIGNSVEIYKLSRQNLNIFPLRGTVLKRELIDGQANWYILELENKLEFTDYSYNNVAIRIKNPGESIKKRKKTITGFFLIKGDEIVDKEEIVMNDLKFIGWTTVKRL